MLFQWYKRYKSGAASTMMTPAARNMILCVVSAVSASSLYESWFSATSAAISTRSRRPKPSSVAQRAARVRRRRQSSRPRHRRQPPSVTRNSSTWFWGEGRHSFNFAITDWPKFLELKDQKSQSPNIQIYI